MRVLLLLVSLLALVGCSAISAATETVKEVKTIVDQLKPVLEMLLALIKEWLPLIKQIMDALKQPAEAAADSLITPGNATGLAAAAGLAGTWWKMYTRNKGSDEKKTETREELAATKAEVATLKELLTKSRG